MNIGGGQVWGVIRNIVILLVLFYLLINLFLFLFQSRLVFFPRKEISTTPAILGIPYENIYFFAEDGIKLNGWYIPSDSARGVILFCHGNAGNISHRLESIKLFSRLKMSVFIFDYRGFGRSEGKPGEKGTYIDAEAAWTFLIDSKNINPRSIVVFGESLGGAIAADLATKKPIGGLIIESTFTSISDLGSEIYPFLPVRLLSRYKYDTLEKIKTIRCPKLLIHSRGDEMIPFNHGRKLFEAALEPKEFLEMTGTHNEGFSTASGKYESRIDSFLNRIFQISG